MVLGFLQDFVRDSCWPKASQLRGEWLLLCCFILAGLLKVWFQYLDLVEKYVIKHGSTVTCLVWCGDIQGSWSLNHWCPKREQCQFCAVTITVQQISAGSLLTNTSSGQFLTSWQFFPCSQVDDGFIIIYLPERLLRNFLLATINQQQFVSFIDFIWKYYQNIWQHSVQVC